jgi:phosphatidylcholine synthase
MAVLIVEGGAESFRWAFVLMLVANVIDATDGTLARRVRVKEVLPGFDGGQLDNLIDFLTYTFLPLLLLWRVDGPMLPGVWRWCLLAPLVASAYGFCQVSAKTEDGYFLGFPSYWNLVAFYLYVLQPPTWLTVGILLTLAFLTFVPLRYLYPSQRGRLNQVTNVLAGLWVVSLVWILYRLGPELGADPAVREMTLLSLLFPAYYFIASWLVSLRLWRRKRRRIHEGTLAV